MKKNNEGYVLAMVMSVVAVLALIASAMLSIGLRNVQTQQAAIDRMQSRYDVEGEIEKAVAVLGAVGVTNVAGKEDTAQEEFLKELAKTCEEYTQGKEDSVKITDPTSESAGIYKLTITAQNSAIIVEAQIELNCTTEPSVAASAGNNKEGSDDGQDALYNAGVEAIRYVSYKTSATTTGSNGEEQTG